MPTLVASYAVDSGGSNTNPISTPSFTPAVGEWLVCKSMTWSNTSAAGAVSGGGLTYSTKKTVNPGGFFGYCRIDVAKVVTSPGAMTVTQAGPAAANRHFLVVERWSNADIATTPASNATLSGSGAPAADVTTTAANSALTWCSTDLNSADPATRAYRLSATETGIYDGHVGSNAVMYSAYAVGAAITAAGTYTTGMTAPTGQAWDLAAIEILNASGTTITVTQTDSAGLTDTAVLADTYPRTITDSAGLTDTAVLADTYPRTVTDSAGLTDTAALAAAYAPLFTDSAGLTDTIAEAVDHSLAVTDSAGLTDTVTEAVTDSVEATDSVGLSDTLTTAAAHMPTFTDAAGLSDSVSTAASLTAGTTDDTGLTDDASATFAHANTFTDSIGLTDSMASDHDIDYADSAGLTDTVEPSADYQRTITDSAGLSDNVVLIAPDPCRPLIAQTLHAVAVALRDCLCAQLANTMAGPVCRCSLMSGDTAIADICDKQANGEGQAWVRMTRLYQSQEFPQPLTGVYRCGGGFWAVEFELGVLRCAVVPDDDGTPPDALALNCEAAKIFDDAAALRWTAECCLPSAMPVVPGEWTPLASGGCVGGRVTVTVQLVPGPINISG